LPRFCRPTTADAMVRAPRISTRRGGCCRKLDARHNPLEIRH